MEYDVTVDRDIYIGGSDIACIMGLSSFKTRWTLLQEKAGLIENEFTGNRYTVYGQKMEPKIRDYINNLLAGPGVKPFEPNRVYAGDFRAHTDGFNGECVLEIKTTSHIYDSVDEYKAYMVQLLKYMEVNRVNYGLLAVYHRPDDFNTDFDESRLHIHKIFCDVSEVRKPGDEDMLSRINEALDQFRADLARLRANPLLTEKDFIPGGDKLVTLSNKVLAFESQLATMKAIEQQLKDAKAALFDEMAKHDVKSWETPNGTKITRVDATPGSTKTVTEFDTEAFKEENPAMYEMYLHEVTKRTAGRSGYVKITLPKE